MNPETLVTQLGRDLFPLAMVALVGTFGLLIALPSIFMVQLRRYKERQMATRIILEMLNRDESVENIGRVMGVWSPDTRADFARIMREKFLNYTNSNNSNQAETKPPVAKSAAS